MDEPMPRLINDTALKRELLEEASIDLVVTSPPYNLGIDYGTYRDNVPYVDYLAFCAEWLANCYFWLKDDGRLCLNVPLDTHKQGSQSTGADLTALAKQTGFRFQSSIVWHNGKLYEGKTTPGWESRADARIYAPVELMVVFYKRWKQKTSGSRISDLTESEYRSWAHGLWLIEPARRESGGHPAPFPWVLAYRCIKLYSYVGDTVLDPFMGSGTTLLEASRLKRRSIGIEIDREYCKQAWKKLQFLRDQGSDR